jgi:CRISPR-associated protein Csc3
MTDGKQRMEENYYLPEFELKEEDTAQQEEISLASEPLFSALLRDVVAKLWPHDAVMADFVNHVAAPLSDRLGHVAAKGGEFVEERRAKGLHVDTRYISDQTMRAHLVNGLFPALRVAKVLQAWGASQFRAYDDTVRRLFIAGYVLHDYLKLPEVETQLEKAGFGHEDAIGPAQLSVTEQIFREWCDALSLDTFLEPVGGVEEVLHDVIYIAANTQTRWGTLRNLSVLPNLTLHPVQRDLAEQLSRLADYLAYIARTPQEVATSASIQRELATLSGQMARFTYHHLADNRGVLSNFIHNAALSAMSDERRVPLLYAPSGVVYLEHQGASSPPSVVDVAEITVNSIRDVIARRLGRSLDGIKRDGKGLKYADYYWLFFNLPIFVELGVSATFKNIHEGRKPSAGKRYAKMQDKGWLDPEEVDLDLPDDVRVDQLAEWCYLAEKQTAEKLPHFDTQGFLLNAMGLEDLRAPFEAIPRDNRAGGVAYYWYFAAGHYLKCHPGLDPAAWRKLVEALARQLIQRVDEAVQSADVPPPEQGADWNDLRAYISRTLTLGSKPTVGKERTAFAAELHRYQNAKRRGRGTTHMCSLCSSAYRVEKQTESAVLFAPQVYSNKLQLGGSQLRRDVCSICGLEMMLRQNLMNRTAASGRNFENRRVRYLYFYPTYFFTPETLELFRRAYTNIRRISFTELRRQLVGEGGTVDLSPETLQRLKPLLLAPEEIDPEEDRYVRLHFPEHEPVTFYFLGVPPPGRDAKDAESWVHPAFLALLIPLCLDAKVVASESSLPLMVEADEFAETIFLDGPHAAITYLTGGEKRINVDRILPTLQRLTVGYLIHTDANTAPGSNDFYRWQDIPALARALDQSPLYAFHYLKKWQRKQQFDGIPLSKARQYLKYFVYLKGEDDMSHARHLTETYLKFYRARRFNSNSILRPVDIAARTVLDADERLFDREGLVEAVYGELYSYIDRAGREGLAYYPRGSNWQSRERAMKEFADYFVNDLFHGMLQGDKSALRGRQLNLLKSACEVIYRDEVARQRDENASA